MKQADFIREFHHDKLAKNLDKQGLGKFTKACEHALAFALKNALGQAEVLSNNIKTLQDVYEARLAELVIGIWENGRKHYIHQNVKDIAMIAFKAMSKEFEDKVAATPLVFLATTHVAVKSTPTVKLADDTAFKKDDHFWNDADYTKDQQRTLDFASNCCAFPKLALYLVDHHKVDLYDTCRLMNRSFRDADTITPAQMLREIAKIKPSEALKKSKV